MEEGTLMEGVQEKREEGRCSGVDEGRSEMQRRSGSEQE